MRLCNAAREIAATFVGTFRFEGDGGLETMLADAGGVTDEPHASSFEVVAKAGRHPHVCLELWRNPDLSDNALLRVYAWDHVPMYEWQSVARLPAFPDIRLITVNAKTSEGLRCQVLTYHEVERGSPLEAVLRCGGALDVVISIEPPRPSGMSRRPDR